MEHRFTDPKKTGELNGTGIIDYDYVNNKVIDTSIGAQYVMPSLQNADSFLSAIVSAKLHPMGLCFAPPIWNHIRASGGWHAPKLHIARQAKTTRFKPS